MVKSRSGFERKLGQILVSRGLISPTQLDLALRIKDAQPHKYLGEILFKIGVPQETIARTLYYSHKRKCFGEVLMDQELISSDQLEVALVRQKTMRHKEGYSRPLGHLLVEMGWINTREHLMALSKHFNMPILTLNDYEPSSLLQKIIGERYAMEHRILVLENSARVIKLVLAEPSIQIMEELWKAAPSHKMLELYLAYFTMIHDCLRKLEEPIPFVQHR